MTTIRRFVQEHYHHYNARVVRQAADAWIDADARGEKMLVSLAGAMSTARLGKLLARLIREDKVHAISCTGANLEEDVYNLLYGEEYREIEDWRNLTADDDQALLEAGYNRVTDTAIHDSVPEGIEELLRPHWNAAAASGEPMLPSQFLGKLLMDDSFRQDFVRTDDSWLLAATEKGIPVYTPGWEDSTTGNMFTASVIRGDVSSHHAVMSGTQQLAHLIDWYTGQIDEGTTIGFFQIGGGIAGDFAICAVPTMNVDLELGVPLWSYFCQITDAIPSYGGYSGAPPNEKITWAKLAIDTPRFCIQSDATIVAPLIFAYVLGD